MMDFPLTLTHIFERTPKLFGKTEIVSRMPDKSLHRYTYRDFYERTRRLAHALLEAGVKKGDPVATLMWNHYAHLEAYFAIPIIGAVLHTLNLRLSPDDIAYIVNHAEDRILIVDDVLLPLYDRFKDKVSFEKVIVVPLTGKPVPEGYVDYEEFIQAVSGDFDYPQIDERDACGMCYTSGTTGRPKGVVYSHRSTVIHAFGEVMADTMCLSMRDVLLPVVPMFHANSWGLPYSGTLVGAKQVFPGPHLDAESLLDLMEAEKVTITAGVPTIWLAILNAIESNPGRWKLTPGMRMIVGGSAAPEPMIRAFDKHNLRVIHAWGMTETSPLGTFCTLKPSLDSLSEDEKYSYRAKQGLPVPFVEVRVVSDRGEEPWDGKSMGELQVRGPWITGSYHKLPPEEAEDKFTEDGWLRTGDVVVIDEEGYVKITDRTKDLIKSGGEWISSLELENAILAHPKVKGAAVIAVPHPKWMERPLAVVVPAEGEKPTAEELREFLLAKYPKWMVPDAFVFVDELPLTSVGKIHKSVL
ncbi:MAG: fatty-acid--CoA ligase, partial [Deltaproteobacteria bacterium]